MRRSVVGRGPGWKWMEEEEEEWEGCEARVGWLRDLKPLLKRSRKEDRVLTVVDEGAGEGDRSGDWSAFVAWDVKSRFSLLRSRGRKKRMLWAEMFLCNQFSILCKDNTELTIFRLSSNRSPRTGRRG